TQDAIPQHSAMLRMGLRGTQFEVGRRPCPRHCRWGTQHEAIGSCGGAGSGSEEAAPRQPRWSGLFLLPVMLSSMHTHSFPCQGRKRWALILEPFGMSCQGFGACPCCGDTRATLWDAFAGATLPGRSPAWQSKRIWLTLLNLRCVAT